MSTEASRNVAAPFHARMLIGGEWIDRTERIEVKNPADRKSTRLNSSHT